jgi:Domain of unknown function (DUF1731).
MKRVLVRLAAPVLMRTDPELALYGRYCVSCRLREEGFEFLFPDVSSALRNLYQRPTSAPWWFFVLHVGHLLLRVPAHLSVFTWTGPAQADWLDALAARTR